MSIHQKISQKIQLRPFLHTSNSPSQPESQPQPPRGGDDGRSHSTSTQENESFLGTNSGLSQQIHLNPPSPNLANRHYQHQYSSSSSSIHSNNISDINENKDGNDDDEQEAEMVKSNQNLGNNNAQTWISSFQNQIQAIRQDMEREAALELEQVKEEILKIRKEQERYEEELKLARQQRELEEREEEKRRLKNVRENEDSTVKEGMDEVDEDTEYWEEVARQLMEDASILEHGEEEEELESKMTNSMLGQTNLKPIKIEDLKDEHDEDKQGNIIPSGREQSSINNDDEHKTSVEELFIVGETDESENEVVNRLTTELKEELVVDKQSIQEQTKVPSSITSNLKPKRKRKKSSKKNKKQNKGDRTSTTRTTTSSVISHPTNNNVDYPLETIKEKLSASLAVRKIIGRSIQATILLIIFSLAAHVVLSEGGGIQLLLKGIFMPFSSSIGGRSSNGATSMSS